MKEKKSKKKYIIIAVIAILIIGGVAGANNKTDDTNTTKDTKTATKEEKKTYKIGDVVNIGKMEYTITNMETTQTLGGEYLNTQANGTFVVITMTIKNNGDKATSVSPSYFKLLSDGKEFETSTDGMIYLQDGALIYESLNPDVSKTVKIAFDVSPETANAANLQLQLQTGAFGTEKDVINLR